jgi:hypothetical protein
LKIQPDGRPVAVDALVVIESGSNLPPLTPLPCKGRGDRYEPTSSLTLFFEPQRVAIIGASATTGKPGYEILRNIQANGFGGEVLCVNPKGGEILGYPATLPPAIAGGVDLAVLIVPASATPGALRDCAFVNQELGPAGGRLC